MTSTYHLILEDIALSARVGAHDWEKHGPRTISASVELEVRRLPGDALDRVVSYAWVLETVKRVCSGPHLDLLETLADQIAEALFEDRRVLRAEVWLRKVGLYPEVGSIGVHLLREGRSSTGVNP